MTSLSLRVTSGWMVRRGITSNIPDFLTLCEPACDRQLSPYPVVCLKLARSGGGVNHNDLSSNSHVLGEGGYLPPDRPGFSARHIRGFI